MILPFPKLTFRSASKLQMGRDILLSADLVNPNQNIACYVMCDEIGEQTPLFLKLIPLT